jgi:hypothetical protein
MSEFTKQLFKLNNHKGRSSVEWFDWFLDDTLATFGRKITTPPPSECVDDLFELGRLYATLVIGGEPFSCILGRTYEELASTYGKKMMGQFFTPCPISEMMAAIQIKSTILDEHQSVYSVHEPASGAGGMILSFIRTWLKEKRDTGLLWLTAVDLDLMCARMTALQIMANAMIHQFDLGAVRVFRGNGLGSPNDWELIVAGTDPRFLKSSQDLQIFASPPEGCQRESLALPSVTENSEGQLLLF